MSNKCKILEQDFDISKIELYHYCKSECFYKMIIHDRSGQKDPIIISSTGRELPKVMTRIELPLGVKLIGYRGGTYQDDIKALGFMFW